MAFCAEIQCLAIIGAEQGLFTLSQARLIASGLSENAEVVDFAQQLIDRDIVEDVAALERVLDEAMQRAASGAKINDPFSAAPAPLKLSARPVEVAAPPRSASPVTKAQSVPTNLPAFPFDRIAALNDTELCAALRALLMGCARTGASDLHLSTGARPFIRKNRKFSFVSDYLLTAEDALRLNTALLSEGQKKTFSDRKDYDYALSLIHI